MGAEQPDHALQVDLVVVDDQHPDPILAGMYLNTAMVVRTAGNPIDTVRSIRGAILEVDAGQPLVSVRTMEGAMAGTVAQPRFQMTLARKVKARLTHLRRGKASSSSSLWAPLHMREATTRS